MVDFAITSPKFGIQESVPTIQLSDAHVAEGTENFRERDGEYQTQKGRLIEVFDGSTTPEPINFPKNIFAITAVDQGNKKFTISGSHAATITTNISSSRVRVNGSSANDQLYTLDTVVDSGGNTIITVTESIPSGTVDGNIFIGLTPPIAFLRHVRQANKAEMLFIGTAFHIFTWSDSTKVLTVRFTATTTVATTMVLLTHLDDVYMTDNVNLVQKIAVSTDQSAVFADLGSASGIDIDGVNFIIKAKAMVSYETYLHLANVTYDDNSVHLVRDHWSSLSDTSDWDTTGAGDAGSKDFFETPDFIVGFGRWSSFLILFKQERHFRGTLVTDTTVFNWVEEELKVGAVSQKAITNDRDGRLYWLASDLKIREFRTPLPVSLFVDKTLRGINTAFAEFAQMTFIDQFGVLYTALPTKQSETNDKILEFNPDTGQSYLHDIPVRAFGNFTRQTAFTYDTLPYDTYAEWGAAWLIYDVNQNVAGFKLDLASGYDGRVYSLNSATKDAGVDFTKTFIFSTTLTVAKTLFLNKRISNGMYTIMNRKSSGSVTLSMKRNTEKTWQALGTIDPTDSDTPAVVNVHTPFISRFKYAQFRLQTTGDIDIIGFGFREFEFDGDR